MGSLPMISRSATASPCVASTSNTTRSACSIASQVRAIPSISTGSLDGRNPAVSMTWTGMPFDADALANRVTRRSRNVSDDGKFLAGKPVEEARLADVGLASQNHPHAFPQQAALLRCGQHLLQPVLQRYEPTRSISLLDELDVLVRKVESGFDQRAQFDQCSEQLLDSPGKRTLQGPQCAACRLCRRCVNQICDALGLRQINLVIEVSAPGELSRLRRARAQLKAALEYQLQHHGPPCPCSSSTSCPVYECGAGKYTAMPSSIAERRASLKAVSVARRGERGSPMRAVMNASSRGPETRTTPIPPRPGAVAMAAMISLSVIHLR